MGWGWVCSLAWQVADTLCGLWGGLENPPAWSSLHNSSVLSAAFAPVFVYFREHRWNFPSRSFWPIEKQFRECVQSQQVKRRLSRDCILVRTRANSVVWKETKTAKHSYNVYFFCLWSGPKQMNYRTSLVWIHSKMGWYCSVTERVHESAHTARHCRAEGAQTASERIYLL